ncbi:phosphoglycolate phosphatase [Afifella sp. IM 167]|uniref:phosphoglycolate phosphatase n=1 Tax=Afifella sp. IM 167 TaxID=2033586 RepID=UPI001CCA4867|nr:phosphoglycolate phosphatase [Afifella sp. IM 167]MBZ8134050.1 phosphoglycolate phosphatase [Afifella sp. IM 167]
MVAATWPRAILFDLDGTLVDSVPDLAGALNALLDEESLVAIPEEEVRGMVGNGVEKLVERGFAARGRDLAGEALAEMTRLFMALYEPRATLRTRLYPGVAETLQSLRSEGIALAVLTNKPAEPTRLILEGLRIAPCFTAVIGGDSGLPKKPDPAVIHAALKMLGVSEEEALMVGDSPADVGAARNAGIPVVVVSYGYTHVPAGELGADHVVDTLTEIATAIRIMRQAA